MTTRIFRVYSDLHVDQDGSFTKTFTIDKSKPNHDGSYDYNIVTVLCTDVAECPLDHEYLTVVITRNTFEECIRSFDELCTQGALKEIRFRKYILFSGGKEINISHPPYAITNKGLICFKRLKAEEVQKLFFNEFCHYSNLCAFRFNLAPLFAFYADVPFGTEKWHVIKSNKVVESTQECLEVIKETEKQNGGYQGFSDYMDCNY